jgi:hypothetical protein
MLGGWWLGGRGGGSGGGESLGGTGDEAEKLEVESSKRHLARRKVAFPRNRPGNVLPRIILAETAVDFIHPHPEDATP